jgi:hypothetical protein
MVFADMQMPMPVEGTQPKEGALAKLGAVTDASSEGFQIVHGERGPTEPANVPGAVADATAGSLEVGRGSGRVHQAVANAATSLTREFDSKGIDTYSRGSWSRSRTATTQWSGQTTWRMMRHPQDPTSCWSFR